MRLPVLAAFAALLASPALAASINVVGPGGSPARVINARPGLLSPVARPGLPFGVRGGYGPGLFGAYGGYGYGDFPVGLFANGGPRDIHDLDITRGSALSPGAPGGVLTPVAPPLIYEIEAKGARGRSLRACGISQIPLGGDAGAALTRVSLC